MYRHFWSFGLRHWHASTQTPPPAHAQSPNPPPRLASSARTTPPTSVCPNQPPSTGRSPSTLFQVMTWVSTACPRCETNSQPVPSSRQTSERQTMLLLLLDRAKRPGRALSRTGTLAFVALLASIPQGSAQVPERPGILQVELLIQRDGGKPVTGLTARDFAVDLNGAPLLPELIRPHLGDKPVGGVTAHTRMIVILGPGPGSSPSMLRQLSDALAPVWQLGWQVAVARSDGSVTDYAVSPAQFQQISTAPPQASGPAAEGSTPAEQAMLNLKFFRGRRPPAAAVCAYATCPVGFSGNPDCRWWCSWPGVRRGGRALRRSLRDADVQQRLRRWCVSRNERADGREAGPPRCSGLLRTPLPCPACQSRSTQTSPYSPDPETGPAHGHVAPLPRLRDRAHSASPDRALKASGTSLAALVDPLPAPLTSSAESPTQYRSPDLHPAETAFDLYSAISTASRKQTTSLLDDMVRSDAERLLSRWRMRVLAEWSASR